MNKTKPLWVAFLVTLGAFTLPASASTATERFLENTQGLHVQRESLDLKKMPAPELTQLTADSFQRALMLQKLIKESPSVTAEDKKQVVLAKALLPKMLKMSREQFAAMQNATFAASKVEVMVSVTGKEAEVIQFASGKITPQIRDYLISSMRSNDIVKQIGFKSMAFSHLLKGTETIDF